MSSALVFVAAPADAATSSFTLPPLPDQPNYAKGDYIVQLKDPAAASYTGGISGYAATHPAPGKKLRARDAAVSKWSGYLAGKQKDAAKAAGVSIKYSYTLAFNGFSAHLTGAQASALAKRSDVLAIQADTILHPQAEPDYQYLGLQNGPIGGSDDSGLWKALGGPQNAGKGVVIGDIDTGISPANPSFAGDPLGTTVSDAQPYLNGSTITFKKADGNTFTGICQTGLESYNNTQSPQDGSWSASDCNTKLIGARYFDLGFTPSKMGLSQGLEYNSPRDGQDHGSHTASTAGGNYGVDAVVGGKDFGRISGMAPAAKIASYKVCYAGPDATTETDDGCTSSDMVAAINQAVADGVDVLNFSIGGSGAKTVLSATDYAFMGAAAAGIFVAAAAGNAGPNTLDNASPWYTTVAASTIPTYEGTAKLGNGSSYPGGTITVPDAGVSGSLVRADQVAAATFGIDDPVEGHSAGDPVDPVNEAAYCFTGSLDPAKVAGKVVVCERGINARVDKSAEVKRAGGIGMILANPTANSLDLDQHSVPTLAIDAPYYQAVWDYAGTTGATVTLTDENTSGIVTPAPQLAGFSSTGPVTAAGSDVLKPDVSAPGVSIIADGHDVKNADGSFSPSYAFLSGTSMATPHIAGLAALYLGVHPMASVSEIKSAMMTTAHNLLDAKGNPNTDPFAEGAGEIDPTKLLTPGLVYLNGLNDWKAYLQGAGYDQGVTAIDPSDLNLPSIAIGSLPGTQTVTRTVTSTQAGSYTATASVPGYQVSVSPSTLKFTAAGQTASYKVTFTPKGVAAGKWVTGSLDWKGSGAAAGITVHTPIGLNPVGTTAPATASGTGLDGSLQIPVTVGVDGLGSIKTIGLDQTTHLPNDGTASDASHSGGGSASDVNTITHTYFMKVPDGIPSARFTEHSFDGSMQTELGIFKVKLADDSVTDPTLDDLTDATLLGLSPADGTADKAVDLSSPASGWYLVDVILFGGAGDFDATSTLFGSTPAGTFTASGPSKPAVPGSTSTVTVNWSGLKPNTDYTGVISYGDSTFTTGVTIASGDGLIRNTAVPTVTASGTGPGARLTAVPGTWTPASGVAFAYQWSVAGKAVAGATSSSYTVARGDLGKPITVTVTGSKAGWTSASAASSAVTVNPPAQGGGDHGGPGGGDHGAPGGPRHGGPGNGGHGGPGNGGHGGPGNGGHGGPGDGGHGGPGGPGGGGHGPGAPGHGGPGGGHGGPVGPGGPGHGRPGGPRSW